ncbi:MAG: C25 family cysteine peptidase [Lysobacterales bacterium]
MTELKGWTVEYNSTAAHPAGTINASFSVPAGTNRLLVVAVSSSTTGDSAQAAHSASFNAVALTRIAGTETNTDRAHSSIHRIALGTSSTPTVAALAVTVSGGTINRDIVYAAVYEGVNQATPIAASQTSRDNSDDGTINAFGAGLAVGAGDLGVEIVAAHNSTNGTVPVITFNASWTSVIGPNGSAGAGTQGVADHIALTTAAASTSQHTVAPDARHSMTGVTVNWDGTFDPGPAQDGDVTLTGSRSLNSYTTLSAGAAAGATSFTVTSAAALALPACTGTCVNSNATSGNGFNTALGPNDLLMIYQPQELGGAITTTDSTAFGAVTDYGQAGLYELVYVASVAANTVSIVTTTPNCTGLKNSYDAGAMVIRVPQLRNLTINSGGELVPASSWNGSTGGVIALDVRIGAAYNPANGTIAINGTGRIRANGVGFRGGASENQTAASGGAPVNTYLANDCNAGARKGESILGWAGDNNGGTCGSLADNNETGSYGSAGSGAFNRGALANGGGGGNSHNAGGGGGANGGSVAAWNGGGNPAAGFASAWALDDNTADANDLPTVTSASTSSGGGRGGYTFGNQNRDAALVAPGCTTFNPGCNGGQNWGGNNRLNRGGLGGRPLNRRPLGSDSVDRLYFGGGGGAGDGNNTAQQGGAAGGGLIFLIAQRITTNAGSVTTLIEANGADALPTVPGHNDAPGGGGAGGTIVALINLSIASNVRFGANGGTGGNQLITNDESEGPGGGGSGGVISVAAGSGAPQIQVLGALGGTSSSTSVTEFTQNGATNGGAGSQGAAPPRNSQPLLCLQDGSTFTTPVTNSFFRARREDGQLTIQFASSAEAGNLGYRLYADKDGKRVSIDGLIASRVIDSELPQSYELSIPDAGYDQLYLADVSITGDEVQRGPFTIGQAYGAMPTADMYDWAQAHAELSQVALQRGLGGAQSAYVKVAERGMQRVSYEALAAAGVDLAGVAVSELAVLGREAPVARRIRGGATFGPGSSIEFFGTPKSDRYARTETYVLRRDPASVREMALSEPISFQAGDAAGQWAQTRYAPQTGYSFSSPVGDPWYAARIVANGGAAAADFPLTLVGPVVGNGRLKLSLWGGLDYPPGALPDHHVRVLLNGLEVATRRFDGIVPWDLEIPVDNLQSGSNIVRIELPRDTGNAADLVHLEAIELRYQTAPQLVDGKFFSAGLQSASSVPDQLFADGIGDIQMLSGTIIDTVAFPALGTTVRSYRVDADEPTELVLSPGRAIPNSALGANSELWLSGANQLLQPTVSPAVDLQPLPAAPAQYWVISHGLFSAQIAPLVGHRQAQGLSTAVIDVEQIYLHYSGGNPDPEAIARFVREVAAPLGAQYLLLVGGDTYDAAGYLNSGSVSFVPTPYARTNEIVAYAPADPLYGDLSGDGVPEIAVGRLPVRTQAEAAEAVRKIIAYETQPSSARMMLVAGATDSNQQLNFGQSASSLGAAMVPVWQRTEVYTDVLGAAAAQSAAVAGFNDGQSLISYTGHSSPTQWAFEQLLSAGQVASLNPNANQPIVLQFGCWTTYFVSPTANTMGHALMLTPQRGASGVMGSTVLLDQPSHDAMAQAMASRLIPGTRIGDAIVAAKREIAEQSQDPFKGIEVYLGIALLGDPAQPIR